MKTQNLILTEFADDWFELEIEMLKTFELDKTSDQTSCLIADDALIHKLMLNSCKFKEDGPGMVA
jgi:hypothetical protein